MLLTNSNPTTNNKNYMDQYCRTKNIHEIQKNRNSYKQLLQNSKTRQNSTTTVHLKLSNQKKTCLEVYPGQKHNYQEQEKDYKCKGYEKNFMNYCMKEEKYKDRDCYQLNNDSIVNHPSAGVQVREGQVQPLLSTTQNIHNIINVSYGKLNSKMKLKVSATADKSLRSMSSHEQLLRHQNSLAVSSTANIGVGLSSNKKKTKLVTLGSQGTRDTKKSKAYIQTSICHQDKSRSISQSHNNSVLNSKYSTSMAHQAAYRSIKKSMQCQHDEQNREVYRDSFGGGSVGVEIVTINSSMLSKNVGKQDLQQLYERVKYILAEHRHKQQQWQQQRRGYKQHIYKLERNLQEQRKVQKTKHSHSISINEQDISKYKSKSKQK